VKCRLFFTVNAFLLSCIYCLGTPQLLDSQFHYQPKRVLRKYGHHKRMQEYKNFISWPATMWGPAIVMGRIVRLFVCLSVCHTRISPKLSEIDLWLLGNWASRFRICHQIYDGKYSSAILSVSGIALRQFRPKWASCQLG